MKLEGTMADIFTKFDLKLYSKYIHTEKGKSVLYVQLKKALYGTIQASLLFWKKLSGILQEWGFELNIYDRCVANRIMNGKQCTILWHVDDLKILHADNKVVTDIIEKLSKQFVKEKSLSITQGLIHKYIGTTIDFSNANKVMFMLYNYIKNTLEELPEEWLSRGTGTSAASHLFSVDPDSEKLSKKDAVFFCHNVAKLLFLSKRARPDIQSTIAFLCKCVREPDTDDAKILM